MSIPHAPQSVANISGGAGADHFLTTVPLAVISRCSALPNILAALILFVTATAQADEKASADEKKADPHTFDWVKVTEKAEWQARDSSGEMVFRDQLWILGGWFDSFAAPPRDVWSSADGKG